MIRMTSILGAAALGFAAVPAQAQSAAFTTGAAAYEEAAEFAVPAETDADNVICAGYWSAWTVAVEEGLVTTEELALLPDGLKSPAKELTSIGFVLAIDESDETRAELARLNDEVVQLIGEVKAGNDTSAFELFDTLGGCQE